MNRLRQWFGPAWFAATLGFRAAPRLSTLALLRTLFTAVCSAGYPVGYRILVDGALQRDPVRVVRPALPLGPDTLAACRCRAVHRTLSRPLSWVAGSPNVRAACLPRRQGVGVREQDVCNTS